MEDSVWKYMDKTEKRVMAISILLLGLSFALWSVLLAVIALWIESIVFINIAGKRAVAMTVEQMRKDYGDRLKKSL